jgi:hypothetical protein
VTGDHPYGRPTAAELIAAVAEFLETEVRTATSGAVNFHALVAANALRIVELAEAIRAGRLDGREAELMSCLRTVVGHRLAISHPGYDR